jgi:hypothetical protein
MKNGASLCIVCGHDTVMIRDSRVNSRNWRWRRRECMACKHKWSTYEVPVEVMSSVEEVLDILHTLGIHVQIIERLLEKARHAGIVGEGDAKGRDTEQRGGNRHNETGSADRMDC